MVLEGGTASHAVACWEDSSIQVVRPVLKESPRPTVSEGLPAVQVLGLCLLFIALLLCRDFFLIFYIIIRILWFLTMAKNWNSVVKNFRNFRKSLRRIWFRTWAFGVHN